MYVIEGARCLLFQSGMPYKYWDLALKCFADNYNFTHYNKRAPPATWRGTATSLKVNHCNLAANFGTYHTRSAKSR